jgi:4-azaleucine resistance transporter AzlC
MGMAFGVLLRSKGYGPPWALAMSFIIYAGALQFIGVGLLAGGFEPFQTALLTLMVNARHIFYGLCLLEEFRALRKTKLYMIFALTDETFSLLCSARPPAGVEKRRFRLCIAALDHLYWIAGSVLGNLAGTVLPFNPRGMDFVMPALFIVIFLQQWQTRSGRGPALLGIAASLVCLFFFGPRWFIVPAMALIPAALTAVWLREKKLQVSPEKKT